MNKDNKSNENNKYIEKVLKKGKQLSLQASKDKNLQNKIKKMSNY